MQLVSFALLSFEVMCGARRYLFDKFEIARYFAGSSLLPAQCAKNIEHVINLSGAGSK